MFVYLPDPLQLYAGPEQGVNSILPCSGTDYKYTEVVKCGV